MSYETVRAASPLIPYALLSRVLTLPPSLSISVRCDLKDLPSGPDGPPTSCSNCTERGLKCVYAAFQLLPDPFLHPDMPLSFSDEFAEVKTVKLLRRGRRLQQVE